MYAILRTKRIKDNNKFSQMCSHNLRDGKNPEENIDKSKSNQNEILIDEFDLENVKEFGGSYSQKIDDYYNKLGVKQRKNSVKCLEFVLTASPEFFQKATPKEKENWVKHQINFARKEFGKNLKLMVLHNDESNMHFHLAVSVEETKTVKFKNRYGEGEKTAVSLNAKRFNRSYLIDLHTRYAIHNKPFGLVRGVEKSKATHTDLKTHRADVKEALNSDYTKQINKEIDKNFGGKNLLGLPNKFTAEEIKEGLTPFVNQLVKRQKSLKTKVKNTGLAISGDVEALRQERLALEKERNNLADLKKDYFEGANTHQANKKRIAELEQELERWKPKEKHPKPEDSPEKTNNVNSEITNIKKFKFK